MAEALPPPRPAAFGPATDPILFGGVDIAVKRDTAAVALVYRLDERLYPQPTFALYDHRIWTPPVKIHTTVVPYLRTVLDHCRVARIGYDPYQFLSEVQRLVEDGYGDRLVEVNQQSEMVAYANVLKSHITAHTFLPYADAQYRSHFSWAAAQTTERGARIVKTRQTRQIDAVVATAMALALASAHDGGDTRAAFDQTRHRQLLEFLP